MKKLSQINIKDFLHSLFFVCFTMIGMHLLNDITPKYWGKETQESDMLVLGDAAGSVKYAKPEDVDVEDVKLGIVVKDESIYYNGIKVEIGQKWSCCGDPFNDPITKIITDIKGDYIQYRYENSSRKNSFHKCIFFPSGSKLIGTEKGYITRKAKVSEINTKDINPEAPMHSIIPGRRIVYNDSIYYYFYDVNNKDAN